MNEVKIMGWIGVDLDGTLAHYDKWRGEGHIGAPIMPMVERVKKWISEGKRVKIFTARANLGTEAIKAIEIWLEMCGLPALPITAKKDFEMIELWDDRCIQVIGNIGVSLHEFSEKYGEISNNFCPHVIGYIGHEWVDFRDGSCKKKVITEGGRNEECKITPISSRICEHGTKSCDVQHEK